MLSRLNWLDIAALILLLRIYYTALSSGIAAELFKLLGTVGAVYISFHYYTSVSDKLSGLMPVLEQKMPLEFLDLLCFIFLIAGGYVLFILLRLAFQRFIKMEAAPRLNKWGGFILGLARGLLAASILLFMLTISSVSYLKQSVARSTCAEYLFGVAPSAYRALWNGVLSRFMTGEKFNQTVQEVEEGLRS